MKIGYRLKWLAGLLLAIAFPEGYLNPSDARQIPLGVAILALVIASAMLAIIGLGIWAVLQ